MNIITAILMSIAFAHVGQQSAPLLTDQSTARPQTRREILDHALRSFDQAVALKDNSSQQSQRLYAEALEGFKSLLRDGIHNAALYYNVANTEVRLGHVGAAIADYRRALRFDPGNEDIRANLEYARSLRTVKIPQSAVGAVTQTLFFWHFRTSMASRLRVGLIIYAVFWLLMLIHLRRSRHIPPLKWTAVACGVIALTLSISVGWDWTASKYRKEGVTIAGECILRKGNGEGYQQQLVNPLPQGVEVRILESRQDLNSNQWYHVELGDEKNGWLRADQVEVI